METYIPSQDILIKIKFNLETSEQEKKLLKNAIDQIIKRNNDISIPDDQVPND